MIKVERFKITENRTSYSAKRGSYSTTRVYAKNLTLEEAKNKLKEIKGITIYGAERETYGNVPAMLYPTVYEIVSQSKTKK